MAYTFTVTNSHSSGDTKTIHGTFTTASGDTTGTLDADTHGLNYIVDYNVTLDTGGVSVPNPKITVSAGTITILYEDTLGYSGKFYVNGK
jgi:hypothetical protein